MWTGVKDKNMASGNSQTSALRVSGQAQPQHRKIVSRMLVLFIETCEIELDLDAEIEIQEYTGAPDIGAVSAPSIIAIRVGSTLTRKNLSVMLSNITRPVVQ